MTGAETETIDPGPARRTEFVPGPAVRTRGGCPGPSRSRPVQSGPDRPGAAPAPAGRRGPVGVD